VSKAEMVADSRDALIRHWPRHLTSAISQTAVSPPPGQRCGTVCLNSFGNRMSPLDNSNDRWKRLCLVS